MADKRITELGATTTPALADVLPIVTDIATTAVTKKVLMANIPAGLNCPEGFLINGKIVPSVASNNLTVAIKGMDGNDPSATNPVYCRINSVVRSITAALSVTKNGGTKWCNSGSTELATKEIDYFVYLGYNATDGVVVGFSRIPYGAIYSDFSATTTNEKFCAISTITNAAAGDSYVVIGRFAATLSATANFYWSVPTFTPINLVQFPIYETRWLLWQPTISFSPGTAPTTVSSSSYMYKLRNDSLIFSLYTQYTNAAVGVAYSDHSVPMLALADFYNISGSHQIAGASVAAVLSYYYNGNAEMQSVNGNYNKFTAFGELRIT